MHFALIFKPGKKKKKMLSVVENRVSLLINSCLNSFPLLLFLVEVEMAEAETRQSGNSQVLF